MFSGERDAALRGGYANEGAAGFAFLSEEPGTIPLFRLFSSSLHDHFYTTSAAERDQALSRFGYIDEGIAAYVLPTQCESSPPIGAPSSCRCPAAARKQDFSNPLCPFEHSLGDHRWRAQRQGLRRTNQRNGVSPCSRQRTI
jgi:hypothetical protein